MTSPRDAISRAVDGVLARFQLNRLTPIYVDYALRGIGEAPGTVDSKTDSETVEGAPSARWMALAAPQVGGFQIRLTAPDGKRLRYAWNARQQRWATADRPPLAAWTAINALNLGIPQSSLTESLVPTRAEVAEDRATAKRAQRDAEFATRVADLRATADKMQSEIDHLLGGGGSGQQRYTARRAAMADNNRDKGKALQQVQAILRAVADVYEDNTQTPYTSIFATKAGAERWRGIYTWWKSRPENQAFADFAADRGSLREVYGNMDLRAAAREFEALWSIAQHDADEAQIAKKDTAGRLKQQEQRLVGRVDGFVPTPVDLARRMAAQLAYPGGAILEPSAGSGRLVQAVLDELPAKWEYQITAVEKNAELAQILRLRFADDSRLMVIHGDFQDATQGQTFDNIIMNPPYEHGLDGIHVRACWDKLNPGGVLVALVGHGVMFRENSRDRAFREWVEDNSVSVRELPENTFKESGVGVRADMVVAKKPAKLTAIREDAQKDDRISDPEFPVGATVEIIQPHGRLHEGIKDAEVFEVYNDGTVQLKLSNGQTGWFIPRSKLRRTESEKEANERWIRENMAKYRATEQVEPEQYAGPGRLKVGDILSSSWGYDQINVDFYQVVNTKNKTVDIRRVSSRVVRSERGAEYVAPEIDNFIGDVIPNKRPSADGHVKISTTRSASLWNGKPVYQTPGSWGH